jgi:regulator of cell morphogenesis and NO signaling
MATMFSAESPVGRIVADDPGAARVFEKLGIDYCCGGKRALREACAARSLDPASVLEEIARQRESGDAGRDWSRATIGELADHIERTHHAYLKGELPRIAGLLGKVVRAHGEHHPEMVRVAEIFDSLSREMIEHMQKEEQILFPALRALERTGKGSARLNGPIACMVREHEDAGAMLAAMREATGGYAPPRDACNTFRVALGSLAELEADMHQHVHKENNILFPAALERLGVGGAA